MQVIISDQELFAGVPPTPSRSSSFPSPSTTPSFTPNTRAPDLPSSAVTVPAILSMLPHRVAKSGPDSSDVDELDIPDDLDLSLPISTLLKTGTSRAHVKAEHSEGAKALVQGDLRLEEYIRWLAVLWRVYSALELGLSEHSNDPILSPTYDPSLLSRAPAIAADITYLLNRLPSPNTPATTAPAPEPSTPLPPFAIPPFLQPVFNSAPPPLSTYINHLRSLASTSSSASSLLAHAYVRYLGDLSGGQYIGARVKKAYELDGSEGTKFYQFENRKGAVEEESGAETRRRLGEIKDWFRAGMDQGVGDDEPLKAHLIKEANLAFALNTHLFSLIRPSSSSTIVPHQPQGRPQRELRYFEKRELEQKRKEAERLRIEGPKPVNTWWEFIERFVLFAGTALAGWLLSHYAVPYVTRMINQGSGGAAHGEL